MHAKEFDVNHHEENAQISRSHLIYSTLFLVFRKRFRLAMSLPRLLWRPIRMIYLAPPKQASRCISTSFTCFPYQRDRVHPNADEHRDVQKSNLNNPHMTSTTSTMKSDVPSVRVDKAPPDLISSVDPNYEPQDDVPENTKKMTGGTRSGDPTKVSHTDLDVGEMEGITIKIAPLRRIGEDSAMMRARLLCPCSSPASSAQL